MSLFSRLFSLSFWAQLFQSFLNTCQRFPLTVASLVVILFITVTANHRLDILTDQQQRNTFLIALGSAFWFVATTLFAERLQWNKAQRYLLALPVFALFSWTIIQQNILIQESTVLILAAALAITFAAYITRRSDNASVWYFNYQLIAAICFAFLSAVILCAGLSFILKSIEYLFEIHIGGRFYQDIWLIGMVFLAPLYFLANIPKQFDYPRSDCTFPKGVHFILSTILVPLSLVYVVILYAYFAKILIQGALPHGHLGAMISWFGVIGIITHIAIYPLHDRGSSILSWFYKYFYLMLIVPLGLLILAIGVRISQYGFTEQRYLVALCAVWFAILIIFSLLKREQFQLKHVTISLAILSALISFGPWGIHQLPINDQFSRLDSVLTKENLLINGTINITKEPSVEVQKSISSMVLFLVQHHAEDKIRPWFLDKEAFDKVRECDQPEESTKGCTSAEERIVKLMGLNYIHYWDNIDNNHLSIQLNEQHQYNRTLAVAGYDTVTKISWLSSQQDANPPYIQGDYTFSINDKSQLLITIDGNETITFDLLAITNRFSMKKGTIRVDADQENKLQLSQAVNGMKAKLLIDELQIWRQNDEVENTTLSGYLLLKLTDIPE
jgi:hypothetical protein